MRFFLRLERHEKAAPRVVSREGSVRAVPFSRTQRGPLGRGRAIFWTRPGDGDPRRRRQVPGDRRSRPNGKILHAFRASISGGGGALFAAPSAFADEFGVGERLDMDQAAAPQPDALADAKVAMPKIFSRSVVFAYGHAGKKLSAPALKILALLFRICRNCSKQFHSVSFNVLQSDKLGVRHRSWVHSASSRLDNRAELC